MSEIELSAGTIDYEDTGGSGPTLVLQHGLAMNGTVWRNVVDDLRADHRCLVPNLPLGAHRLPMRPDADLSMAGIAGLIAEFLDRLELDGVTLVVNDWGGGQLLAADGNPRLAALVLTPCEAFDNVPPGLPGRGVAIASAIPGGINAMVQPMRMRWPRRLPMALGWMSKRPIPHEIVDDWFEPLLTNRDIRRDLRKYARTWRDGRRTLVEAADRLRSFDRPALVAWAPEDRVMRRDHGRQLADLLPQGHLVEIDDSYALMPEDQPSRLAAAIRDFVRDTTNTPETHQVRA
jgi:pimeloyl-ACP methyl ester carboxylesterase